MMKLLFIPTGNVFVLPDEEALKIKQSDRGNYKILDGGLLEEEEPKVLEPKTVQELVMQEPEYEAPEKEEEPRAEEPKEYSVPLVLMKRQELVVLAKRCGIKVDSKMTNQILREKISEVTGEKIN